MDRKLRSLAIAAFAAIVPAVLATAPIPGDPFVLEFTNDPAVDPPFTDDLGETYIGDTMYIHGVDGVHAQFPATGNFVLDPDRDVKGKKERRFIKLTFPDFGDPDLPAGVYRAFFMAMNGVGQWCDGSTVPPPPPPRDLAPGTSGDGENPPTPGDCVRVTVGASDIRTENSEEPYYLRCRPDVEVGNGDPNYLTARAECTSVDTDYCTDWDIYAASDGTNPRLTCALFEYVKGKGPAVFTQIDGALYNMAFTAHVHRQ